MQDGFNNDNSNVIDLPTAQLRQILERVEREPVGDAAGLNALVREFKAALNRKDKIDEKFRELMAQTSKCIAGLNDPERGPIGQQLLQAAAQSGVHERVKPCVYESSYKDSEDPYDPSFASFGFAKSEYGYANAINYDPNNTSFERFLRARVHEVVHATATNKAPVLHASPWNPDTDIILCPRDFVRMALLLERDAYAKEAWLCQLASKEHPAIITTADNAPITPRWFGDLREAGVPLDTMLQKAARTCLEVRHSSKMGNLKDHADYYVTAALESYKVALKARKSNNMPFADCIRLDDEDILSIGDSYGPNLFKDENGQLADFYREMPELSDKNKKLLEELNAELGIDFDENRLRTLGSALNVAGKTKDDFLQRSRHQGVRIVEPKPEKAVAAPMAATMS